MSPRPPAKRRRRTSTARRRKATGSEEPWLIGLAGLVALSLVVAGMSWLAARPRVLVVGLLAAGAAGALWLRRRQEAGPEFGEAVVRRFLAQDS